MDRKKGANDTKQPSAQISAPGSVARASLPQRVGESASGLLKELFKQSSPRTVTGTLASLNADDAKAGSSSSSTGTGESSWAFRSSSQYEQATVEQGGSFRSNEKAGKSGRSHDQVAFDEFAQDAHALSGDHKSGFSLGIAESNLPRVQVTETWKTRDENQEFADRKIDGAAVVALLSDPAFTIDEEPSSTLDLENNGRKQDYERLKIRKAPGKTVDALHPSNALHLMPDFGAPWSSIHASVATQKGIHERGRFLESRFGNVQPWIDILDTYHDEVWGDILPLVQEAREELKAANENWTCHQDGPAIRRLKMVLQHLGSPNN